MSIRGKACVVGIYEHPLRRAPDISTAQIHAEVAKGALEDAGLTIRDVDGFFCSSDAPGLGPINMVDYLGIDPKYVDSTNTGGSSYLVLAEHAAQAIAGGRCSIALITLAGRPASEGMATGTKPRFYDQSAPDVQFEYPYAPTQVNLYAMAAHRHMYEFGTTSEDLAWIRVAASHHAQHNAHAVRRDVVTVDDVVNSPMIADPLHRLDCCLITDGGGAIIMAHPDIAKTLPKPVVTLKGARTAVKGQNGGQVDLTFTGTKWTAPMAFQEAGVSPNDIKYASIYDSFTITVLQQLEDLGFCEKGEGGKFVRDGNLISGVGSLAINTDGGGLCNNHPANRGGMTKIIEAVRQLRGAAHPAVQVPACDLALVNGIGGSIGTRHGAATLILEREN